MRKGVLKFLPLLVLVWAQAGAQPEPWVAFPATARYAAGDDPRWADPGFDDSGWTPVPLGRSWHPDTRQRVGEIGWLRWPMVVSRPPREPLMLCVGFVGNCSEVYLNGTLVSTNGSIHLRSMPPQRTLHGGLVPESVLRIGANATNVVAVRVLNLAGSGGLLGGPMGVYPAGEFLPFKNAVEMRRDFLLAVLASLCFGWVVIQLILAVLQPGHARGLFFGTAVLTFLSGLLMIISTRTFQQSSWNGAYAMMAFWLVTIVFPPLTLFYLRRAFSIRLPHWLYVLVIVVALGFIAGTMVSLITEQPEWLAVSLVVHLLVSGVASMHVLGKAILRREFFAKLMLVSLLISGTAALLHTANLAVPLFPQAAMTLLPNDLSTMASITLLSFGLLLETSRHFRRERRLRARLMEVDETERRRVGHDLHDGVLQDLQHAHLGLQMLRGQGDLRADQLDRPIQELRGAIREVRAVAENLQPFYLKSQSLADSLEYLLRAFEERYGQTIESDIQPVPDLGDRYRELLYRLVQEAVGNACRHAKAERIWVTLRQAARTIQLEVRDNGVGFFPQKASDRLGLGFMRERAELAGGRFDLQTAPGRGTTIRLELPNEKT